MRFVASVLVTSGVALLIDVAATLVWQEPVSAAIAGREQGRLADRLAAEEDLARRQARDPAARAGGTAGPARLAARRADRLKKGDAFGRIVLPSLGRSYVVVEGTDTASLRKGPGHYPDTALPGQGATVAIAGHRTTWLAPFRPIDKLRRGDPIEVQMPYGRFRYRVGRTRIVTPGATWVKRDTGRERLVLTACHPLYSAAKRIAVFASLSPRPSDGRSRASRKRIRATTRARETARTASQ